MHKRPLAEVECECGCGKPASIGCRFIVGHNMHGENLSGRVFGKVTKNVTTAAQKSCGNNIQETPMVISWTARTTPWVIPRKTAWSAVRVVIEQNPTTSPTRSGCR